jgi:hypothetical protein
MAQIDILVVVDAEKLVAKLPGGTVGNETPLGSFGTSDPYIYMIAPGDFVVSNQAKSELNVKAHSGDTIRWTITSPTRGQALNPILYNFKTNDPNALTPPQMLDITLTTYAPSNLASPSTPPFAQVNYQDYAWNSTLLLPGQSVQYTWDFLILDNDGTMRGAYTWDPFITIAGKAPMPHLAASNAQSHGNDARAD